MDELFVLPLQLQGFLYLVFATGFLVIIYAILSSQALGGRLGAGLKKISAGSIVHVALFVALQTVEQQHSIAFLSPDQLRLFFIIANIFGSVLLVAGYIQIYRVSKELKLFY